MRKGDEKMQWWDENANGCPDIVNEIADADFYYVENPSTYTVGPLGGAMYRPWNFETKMRPAPEDFKRYLQALVIRCPEVIGVELARVTRPLYRP